MREMCRDVYGANWNCFAPQNADDERPVGWCAQSTCTPPAAPAVAQLPRRSARATIRVGWRTAHTTTHLAAFAVKRAAAATTHPYVPRPRRTIGASSVRRRTAPKGDVCYAGSDAVLLVQRACRATAVAISTHHLRWRGLGRGARPIKPREVAVPKVHHGS